MTYGITDQGFVPKRLADIKEELEASYKLLFGDGIDLSSNSVFGQTIGVYAERESLLWELAESIYNSQYPKTSFNTQLDNVVSMTGITRQPGIKSYVDLTFFGTANTTVPAGSVFSVVGNVNARFVLDTDVIILDGKDEIQKITFSAVPDAGSFKINYNGEVSASLSSGSTSQNIEDALNGLAGLSTVTVTGDFSVGFTITFAGDDGLKNHPTLVIQDNTLELTSTPVTTSVLIVDEGYPNQSTAKVEAEVIGEVYAPSGSLTVIENPVTGLDSTFNLLDAVVGRDVESDAELKIRREESLQRAGAAVLGAILAKVGDLDNVTAVVGFENITFLIDSDSRPPKSFEIVVQGGDDVEIATAIWDSKPAGIESYGSESEVITDSQGFSRTIKYSRPTDINIWVELDLTTNADFPQDGLQQVEDAVLAHGNDLGIGEDVIVYPKLLCALNSVDGITDLAIRIGTSSSPTTDDNIAIAPQEISSWDSSRIIVQEI